MSINSNIVHLCDIEFHGVGVRQYVDSVDGSWCAGGWSWCDYAIY